MCLDWWNQQRTQQTQNMRTPHRKAPELNPQTTCYDALSTAPLCRPDQNKLLSTTQGEAPAAQRRSRGHCENCESQGEKSGSSTCSPAACAQRLISSRSAPTGVGTIDTEHASARLIAAYLRLSQTNNWQPITLHLTASGCCRSDVLRACLPTTCSPRRAWKEIEEGRSDPLIKSGTPVSQRTHQERAEDWFKPQVHFLCGNERLEQIYFCCLERRGRLMKAAGRRESGRQVVQFLYFLHLWPTIPTRVGSQEVQVSRGHFRHTVCPTLPVVARKEGGVLWI